MSLCCFGGGSRSSGVSPTPARIVNERFFVITTIFNPSGYRSRYDLYHRFAAHMRRTGAQLITVECIFPRLGQQKFQVTSADNPYHIQVQSDFVYWMKESLINIAVSHLPLHAAWVCWLDADIEFMEENWIDKTIAALQGFAIVQVFGKAEFLGPPPRSEVLRTDYSFGYSVLHGKVIDQARYDEWYPHPGYGWATSVDIFKQIGGLPDYDLVGSGDLHFAFSLLGRVSNALEEALNPAFKKYVLEHSAWLYSTLDYICASASEPRQTVGYVPLTIRHHWHGSRKNRQYVDRWKILIAHNFNYETDTLRNAAGLLEFVGPSGPALQRDILQHFTMRKEDASKLEAEDKQIVLGARSGERGHGNKKKKSPAPSAPKSKNHVHQFGHRDFRTGGHSSSHGYMAAYTTQQALDAAAGNSYPHYHYDYAGTGHEYGHGHDPGCATYDYSNNYGGAISCTSNY